MTKQERRVAQAAVRRAHDADQQARPNEPPAPAPDPSSPAYCGPNIRGGHRHTCWRSQRDGLRHCYHCSQTIPEGVL